MKFSKAYDQHSRVTFSTTGVSLTHQSMAPECDINSIMKKYEKTGVLEHRNSFEGQYGDFTSAPENYHASMNAVIVAKEMFATLPAKMRRRFHNDPGAFIDFVGNPEHAQDLIDMGLATARPAPRVDPTAEPPKKAAPAASPEPDKAPKPAE